MLLSLSFLFAIQNITILFDSNSASMEQKLETMRMLRHLNFEKVVRDNHVIGFSFNITEFNEALAVGLKRQKRKTCSFTQTDPSDLLPRPPSPSVIDSREIQSIFGSMNYLQK